MAFGKAPSWFKKKGPETSESFSVEDERDNEAAAFRPEDKIGKGKKLDEGTRSPRDYSHEEWASIVGPALRETFEGVDDHHDAGSADADETPRETRSRLESLIGKLGLHKNESDDEVLELSEKQAFKDIDIVSTKAYERREERAQKFAEKYGIADVRQELLVAEREYTDAVRELKAKMIKLPFSRIPDEIRDKYDDAALRWRESLFAAVDLAPQKEKQQATIISFRDTVMRAEEARQRGVLEASTIRDQKLFGKVLTWGQSGLGSVVKGYLKGTHFLGNLAARGHARSREYLGKEGVAEEQLVERYTRATRIVSGAVLGTLVMGNVGAAGVATSVLFKAARGTLGLAVGSVAGVYTGKGYRMTAGKLLRENNRDAKRDQRIDENDLDFERQAWRFGRGSALEKQTRVAEMLGAFLGGASTSLMSNAALHEMASASSVQNAHEALAAPSESPQNGHVAHPPVPEKASQVAPLTETPHADTTPLIVSRGEGADKLISDLQDKLRAQYPNSELAPENVKALLRFNPHTTAEQLGLGTESGGVMLHPGDSLGVDDHGRLIFHDNIHDRDRIIINEKHELHPLRGHVAKADSIKQHTTHEHSKVVRHHKVPFDAKADRLAVAEANKEELSREQHGRFGEIPKPASEAPLPPEKGDTAASAISAPPEGAQPKIVSPEEFSAQYNEAAIPVATHPEGVPTIKPEDTIPANPGVLETPPGEHTPETPKLDEKVGTTVTASQIGPEQPKVTPGITSPEEFVKDLSTNSHGVFIDDATPRVYVTENQGIAVYGGNDTAARLIATEYAKSHPGTEVFFQVRGVDGLGNQVRYSGEVSVDTAGTVSVNIPDPRTEAVVPPPDPNTFIEVKP